MFNFRKPRHQLSRDHAGELRLSDLKPGEKGIILEIGGSEQFRIRLLEMGLTKGIEVSLDKYAPLMDPMELIVRGYHLSLREVDAHKIAVERSE
jgi:Fe2+ transport system protein FeoA